MHRIAATNLKLCLSQTLICFTESMNLLAFFTSPDVLLPRAGYDPAKGTFDTFLRQTFDKYLQHVSAIDDMEFPSIRTAIRNSRDKIEHLSGKIVEAVKHYLGGYPYPAYKEIEDALKSIAIERLFSRISQSNRAGGFPGEAEFLLECILHPPLYRVRAERTLANDKRPARRDIFHVPFDQRHKVGNQRYSIAGLPCLYLGSSIWICWEELNRPELDSIWISRFRLSTEVTVLDFQFPPALAWHLFGAGLTVKNSQGHALPQEFRDRFDERFIASYVLCWPLIASCSVRVQSRIGSFFPHYIVPQMVLQWVTKEKRVNGIRYFSTRTAPREVDTYAHCSYVFPARNICGSGYCSELQKQFLLTAPISWEFLQNVDIHRSNFGPSNADAAVNLSDDFRVRYASTGFFKAEQTLGVIESDEGHSMPVEEN